MDNEWRIRNTEQTTMERFLSLSDAVPRVIRIPSNERPEKRTDKKKRTETHHSLVKRKYRRMRGGLEDEIFEILRRRDLKEESVAG
jgi:hypothetical protein